MSGRRVTISFAPKYGSARRSSVGSVSWKSIISPFMLHLLASRRGEVELRVHELAVALDVAALAADDEDDEIVVGAVRDQSLRRRLDVHEAALADLVLVAVERERRGAAVDEVQLVLSVVVVVRPFVARREHERVDAERGHAERLRGSCGTRSPSPSCVERI